LLAAPRCHLEHIFTFQVQLGSVGPFSLENNQAALAAQARDAVQDIFQKQHNGRKGCMHEKLQSFLVVTGEDHMIDFLF
jgi:hypothetical protein